MLFESLKHIFLFLGALYFGLICGIIKEIFNFILNLLKNKKVFIFLFDFIFIILFSFLFIFCLNIVNYGEFRVFLLISFILGYFIERKSLGNLVDFLIKKIYNFLKIIVNKIRNLKIFKRMFNYDRKSSKKTNKNC